MFPETVNNLYAYIDLYGGKEREYGGGLNVYDFGARTYAPDIARF